MADHRVVALARAAAVDIALAPAHRPEARAQIGAGASSSVSPKAKRPGLIADERGEDVPFAQRHPDGDAQRFLAFAQKDAAGDLPAAIKAGEFFFDDTRQQHPAVGTQIAFAPLVSLRVRACDFTGLQHRRRIRNGWKRTQWFSFPRFSVCPSGKMAVREGFEPSVRFNPYNALAKRRFRPLSHLTGCSGPRS